MDYQCSRCGKPAYFDGRNGDGPILVCGCDKLGPPAFDSRMGSPTVYYPSSEAHPVPSSPER